MEEKMKRNQRGFTLIEIIAVLVILGILAAVAIPKYLDIQNEARVKAAKGQVAEVKGRLSTGLAGYMLSNGSKPAGGSALVTFVNNKNPNSCPTSATTEGDFEFACTGQAGTKIVVITVTEVQTNPLNPSVTGTFTFSD